MFRSSLFLLLERFFKGYVPTSDHCYFCFLKDFSKCMFWSSFFLLLERFSKGMFWSFLYLLLERFSKGYFLIIFIFVTNMFVSVLVYVSTRLSKIFSVYQTCQQGRGRLSISLFSLFPLPEIVFIPLPVCTALIPKSKAFEVWSGNAGQDRKVLCPLSHSKHANSCAYTLEQDFMIYLIFFSHNHSFYFVIWNDLSAVNAMRRSAWR